MNDNRDDTLPARPPRTARAATYEFVVEGALSPAWLSWLDDLTIVGRDSAGPAPTTTLVGTIADQPALRGTLARLWDLNLVIVAVHRLDPAQA